MSGLPFGAPISAFFQGFTSVGNLRTRLYNVWLLLVINKWTPRAETKSRYIWNINSAGHQKPGALLRRYQLSIGVPKIIFFLL